MKIIVGFMLLFFLVITLNIGCDFSDKKIVEQKIIHTEHTINDIYKLYSTFKPLQDTIKNFRNNEGIKVCRFFDDGNFFHFILTIRNTPYTLRNEHKIIKLNAIDYCILESNVPLDKNFKKNSLLTKLIQQKRVILESEPIKEEFYSLEYIICKINLKKYSFFNHQQLEDSISAYSVKNKVFDESIFHPICNQ